MANSIARFNPQKYAIHELEILSNTFEEIFFKYYREYKRVEYANKDISDIDFGSHYPYKTFIDNEEVTEDEYEKMLNENTPTIERNHLAFLHDYKVCDFFIYHMHDGRLLPVIEVDFFSEAEREKFVRPYWFGDEVDESKFGCRALWDEISQKEEV